MIKSQKLAEGDKAEAGKAKRIAKVPQKYIDLLLNGGFPRLPTFDGPSKSRSPAVQARVAHCKALVDELRAYNDGILAQYKELGHAFHEVEEEPWIDEAMARQLARKKPIPPPASS